MTIKTTEEEVQDIGNYFSDISHVFLTEYEKKGLKKHTKHILNFFKDKDLSEDVILELGCGIGGLLFNFLDLGVKEAYGIDLSEKMIEGAKSLSKTLNYEQKTHFYVGDFNSLSRGILPIKEVDIVIADRVFCCSPVPKEILKSIIDFKPKTIVVVQPRKSYLSRFGLWINIKLKQIRWGVKGHKTQTPYTSVKEYDQLCQEYGYKRILQKYRYYWEVIIYQKRI